MWAHVDTISSLNLLCAPVFQVTAYLGLCHRQAGAEKVSAVPLSCPPTPAEAGMKAATWQEEALHHCKPLCLKRCIPPLHPPLPKHGRSNPSAHCPWGTAATSQGTQDLQWPQRRQAGGPCTMSSVAGGACSTHVTNAANATRSPGSATMPAATGATAKQIKVPLLKEPEAQLSPDPGPKAPSLVSPWV